MHNNNDDERNANALVSYIYFMLFFTFGNSNLMFLLLTYKIIFMKWAIKSE